MRATGKSVVFWSRSFIRYMRKKSYSHFGVPLKYLKHSMSGTEAYDKFQDKPIFLKDHPEVRHLWQDWRRERIALFKTGYDFGQVLNRKTKEQYTFNTSTAHLPWQEHKYYPEVENLDVTDCLIASAERLASKGRTIDFFWSGGIDSTAALIALNEVCPKQLHVIIGHSTEYPEYYDKVVKHLDHTINEDSHVFREASPDKHVYSACGEADIIFGAIGFGKSRFYYQQFNKELSTEEKVWLIWERIREYRWAALSFRFLLEWEGDKMDMDNYMPMYCQPTIEKWVVNEHLKGPGEGLIWPYIPDNIDPPDEIYLKCKMPLRDHIYKFTKDKEFAYKKGKQNGLIRGQILSNRIKGKNFSREGEHIENYQYRVWGILDDGTILTKDNIHKYNWRDFFHHYKEEWY